MILEKNEVRRFVEKYLPWNRVQLLFHGGLSRGGQQQSRIAERDAFSQASAFSSFSRIGVIGARFFFFLFSFSFLFSFCRATRSRTIYKKAVWIGMNRERWNDGAENFSYGRLSIRRSQPPSLEPWENRIESRVKEDGKRGSGGGGSPPRGGKSRMDVVVLEDW